MSNAVTPSSPTTQQKNKKKRDEHSQKLKQQLQKFRQQKQKQQQQRKQKQKEEQQKTKKKEQKKQQYLEEKKKLIQSKKQELSRKAKEEQQINNRNIEKKKVQVKAKEMELLERERKYLEVKRERVVERNRELEKEKEKSKFVKSKSHDKLINQVKNAVADVRMRELLIKNSMENGEIKQLIEKYKKNFEDLFQVFWNWQKKKMQLKNLAQMLKDFQTSKYLPPKDIAQIYKTVSKGQLLSLETFIQCIVKLSYKSTQIEQQVEENSPSQKIQNVIKIDPFQFMLVKLLRMNQPNYKQTVVRIRNQKINK